MQISEWWTVYDVTIPGATGEASAYTGSSWEDQAGAVRYAAEQIMRWPHLAGDLVVARVGDRPALHDTSRLSHAN